MRRSDIELELEERLRRAPPGSRQSLFRMDTLDAPTVVRQDATGDTGHGYEGRGDGWEAIGGQPRCDCSLSLSR